MGDGVSDQRTRSWISFLVTGPEEKLMKWQYAAMFLVELFDRRGQTVLCRAHAGPPFMDLKAWQKEIDEGKEHGPELAEKLLEKAIELAKKHDVTVQSLEGFGDQETYRVLTLGTHGLKWPPEKKKGKKVTA